MRFRNSDTFKQKDPQMSLTYYVILTLILADLAFYFLLVMVQEDYHGHNPYHNAVHAADVTQAMHCYLKEPKVRQDLVASEKPSRHIAKHQC